MIILPPSTVKRKLPANFCLDDINLFDRELSKQIHETQIIRKRTILFRIEKDLNSYEKQIFKRKHYLKKNFIFFTSFFGKDTLPLLWIIDSISHTYFHWFLDAIPRLVCALKNVDSLILPLPESYKEHEYIHSSLEPLMSRVRPSFMSYKDFFLFKELLFTTKTAPTGNYNEKLIREIRSLYREYYLVNLKLQSKNIDRRIYISRSLANRRRIKNEKHVIQILLGYGFEIVVFENLQFIEQIRICINARYLVSNHGAGLTNMLFMSSGSSILELRRDGDRNANCYFSLASALRLNYYYQKCETVDLPNKNLHHSDIFVDTDELRKNVSLMFRKKSDIC